MMDIYEIVRDFKEDQRFSAVDFKINKGFGVTPYCNKLDCVVYIPKYTATWIVLYLSGNIKALIQFYYLVSLLEKGDIKGADVLLRDFVKSVKSLNFSHIDDSHVEMIMRFIIGHEIGHLWQQDDQIRAKYLHLVHSVLDVCSLHFEDNNEKGASQLIDKVDSYKEGQKRIKVKRVEELIADVISFCLINEYKHYDEKTFNECIFSRLSSLFFLMFFLDRIVSGEWNIVSDDIFNEESLSYYAKFEKMIDALKFNFIRALCLNHLKLDHTASSTDFYFSDAHIDILTDMSTLYGSYFNEDRTVGDFSKEAQKEMEYKLNRILKKIHKQWEMNALK